LALARGIMSKIFGLPVFRPTLDIQFLNQARLAFIVSWVVICVAVSYTHLTLPTKLL
jgi:hypothetical protein